MLKSAARGFGLVAVSLAAAGLGGCGGGGSGGGSSATTSPAPVVAVAPAPNKTLMLFIPDLSNISVAGRSAATGNTISIAEDTSAINSASLLVSGTLSNGGAPGASGTLAGSAINRLGNISNLGERKYDGGITSSNYLQTERASKIVGGNLTFLQDASYGITVYQATNSPSAYVGGFHHGNATAAANVPTNVSATYNGFFTGLELRTGQDAALGGAKGVAGAMSLTADFTAGTVNGSVSNIVDASSTSAGYGLTMTGTIQGNAYSGTTAFTGAAGNAAGVVSSSAMNGAFYGANAAETAGAVRIEGTAPIGIVGNNVGLAVVGGFGGTK